MRKNSGYKKYQIKKLVAYLHCPMKCCLCQKNIQRNEFYFGRRDKSAHMSCVIERNIDIM